MFNDILSSPFLKGKPCSFLVYPFESISLCSYLFKILYKVVQYYNTLFPNVFPFNIFLLICLSFMSSKTFLEHRCLLENSILSQ